MGISVSHLIILALVVLVLFGTGRLPRLMEDLGKGITSFKKGLKDEGTKTIEDESKEK